MSKALERRQPEEVVPTTVVEAQMRGEVDMQVATAHRYPRNVARAVASARAMATADEATAASCYYSLPRGGKAIEGKSVRLAEIVASSWGNLRLESRIVDMGDRFVTAQATVWDLESNVLKRGETTRRITNSRGEKYSDDMIQQTCQAACSIAMRDAIFDVIPPAIVESIYRECRDIAKGDAKSLNAARDACVLHFAKLGASSKEVAALMGRETVTDITGDDLATLRGLATAIQQGETTIDEAFSEVRAKVGLTSGTFGFARKPATAPAPEPEPVRQNTSHEAHGEGEWPDVPAFDEATGEVEEAPAMKPVAKKHNTAKARQPGEEG